MNSILSLAAKVREKGNYIIQKKLKDNSLDGLCPSHGDILNILFNKGSSTMAELATQIHKTKATTTVLVDKLQNKDIIERETNKKDARSTIISLTENGKKLKPFFDDVSKDLDSMISEKLTNEEINTLEKLLDKIVSNK